MDGKSLVPHKAKIVEIGMWIPLTLEEQAKVDAKMNAFTKDMNIKAERQERPLLFKKQSAPTHTESEEYRMVLKILIILPVAIWIVIFFFQFINLTYQRDYHLLVIIPLDRWAEEKLLGFRKLFTRKKSNLLS